MAAQRRMPGIGRRLDRVCIILKQGGIGVRQGDAASRDGSTEEGPAVAPAALVVWVDLAGGIRPLE
eukprot:CAMPEP_0202107780 /NCGR_PEP_ID=MMETSP0965-20130614/18020_1 /ASSEMBLY_ACC=CAM_ASM_000507 /TAXON_ID=4773 /ORGANISM="Schizochytrium aggregatum, Strain ATCC28209" /LENGTH=65 /DNA_ID=CAMNT_0048676969 /DNA_START=106 /DNA_END=300 /DNA_ORIENTATION=+